MIDFRGYLVCIFFLWIFNIWAHALPSSDKIYTSFWHPTLRGERLDYCTYNHKDCGKIVADRYCKMMGYDFASQNVKAHNLGLTHFLDTRLRCQGFQCNGFSNIACAKHLKHNPPRSYHYRKKRFVVPRYNQYRVDWCYKGNQGCGLEAANSFCSRMGFIKAKHYKKDVVVAATKKLGTEELCFNNHCQSFKVIVCAR